MTKSRKTRSKSFSIFKINLKDERWPKVMGILTILIALYLAVAFISYFYTWKVDQDKVIHFSWKVLFQGDLSVSNWLGRLGALVSNIFFYWGFGLPSIVIIFLLLKLGIALIRRNSLIPVWHAIRKGILFMAFLSLTLEFVLRTSEFTWGGAFGEGACYWLTNFIGQAGLFLLLLFSLMFFLVWRFNPNLDQFMAFAIEHKPFKFKVPFQNLFNDSFQSDKTEKRNDEKGTSEKGLFSVFQVLKPSHAERAIPKTGDRDQGSGIDLDIPDSLSNENRKQSFKGSSMDMEVVLPSQSEKNSNEGELSTKTPLEIAREHATGKPIIPATEDEIGFSEPYDPTLDLSRFELPTVDLLENYDDKQFEVDRRELEANKDQIIETLLNYKIEITKIRATIGPTVTLYEIVPAPGVKISKIKNLEDDIALSLSALGIRIIAPIPGKGTIGIEVPNKRKQIVSLREVLQSEKYLHAKMDLPIALGKTISNEVFVADLAKMPHLLIAGATGQGKSVGINTVLMSILYKKHPSQVKLVLIDPKKVELFPYASLEQHYLGFLPNEDEPIVTETNKVVYTLNSLCIEMDERYDLLKNAKARTIKEYNEKFTARKLNPKEGHRFLPYIVLVIDEFADLIMTAGKEVELPIARLAQLARAIGIHLIIATQRPSVNIITGVIKANFPARLAFKVTSKIDSRTILDQGGAEQLIGRGDMLLSIGSSVIRLQCAFVDTPEVERVIDFVSKQQGFPEPYYLPEFSGDDDISKDGSDIKFTDLDDCFDEAARLIVSNQHGSTSMIQRKMQLGYNRAGRIMDQMEALGIVGPAQGSKPRDVLFYSVDELDTYLNTLKKNG